jgi:hypothetical protein
MTRHAAHDDLPASHGISLPGSAETWPAELGPLLRKSPEPSTGCLPVAVESFEEDGIGALKKRLAAMLAKTTAAPKVAVATPAVKVIRVAVGSWTERPTTAAMSPASAAEPSAAAAATTKKMSLASTFPPGVGDPLPSGTTPG